MELIRMYGNLMAVVFHDFLIILLEYGMQLAVLSEVKDICWAAILWVMQQFGNTTHLLIPGNN